jgi:hypothetical protein
LVVLAVSDESEERVSAYVEKNELRLRIGAGFKGGQAWGVDSYPSAVLIDREGNINWTGHPGELRSSQVLEALEGK